MKKLLIQPGKRLSLQLHHHRHEHWVVVKGSGVANIDGKDVFLSESQSIQVPMGTVHSLYNPGKIDLELIEVQTGSYLGEDDITRFEDVYARK